MSKKQDIIFVGLDVHKASINVAVLRAGSTQLSEQWQITNEPKAIRRLVKKLKKQTSGLIKVAYEAGPAGYALLRQLRSMDLDCIIIAPSLIPRRPGDQVKTDRRDASKLAFLLRSGLLTEVTPPSVEEESVRDVMRARDDASKDLRAARHRLLKHLDRHGYVYRDGKHWTAKHKVWIRSVKFEFPSAQFTHENYLLSVEQIEERLKQLNIYIEELSHSSLYAEQVGWLRCMRGVDTITAMTIVAEIHNFKRFQDARSLMSYLGLTPSEYSSGGRQKRGGITKNGNQYVRRILVEAAWNYRHRPAVSMVLRKRREGQPPEVIAIADRAQQRLYRRYRKLKDVYNKPHNVVTVAIARELAGFIWSVLNHRQTA